MDKSAKGFAPLRRALLAKTEWSKQVLSWRVKAVKRRMPMKTGVAQAIVAHDQNLRLDRYLSSGDLDEVQQMMARLGSRATALPASGNGKRAPKARGKETVNKVINFSTAKIKTIDPFLASVKLTEAAEMSAVYPMLYVLENSIRNVIRGIMETKFGADWWNTALTSAKVSQIRNKVAGRLKNEEDNSWHQRRGAHEIDYIDITDLLVIAQSRSSLFFPRILGKATWFQALIDEVSPSRHVLCHMNPLSRVNATSIEISLTQWHNHLKNREAEIRTAMTPKGTTAGATAS